MRESAVPCHRDEATEEKSEITGIGKEDAV